MRASAPFSSRDTSRLSVSLRSERLLPFATCWIRSETPVQSARPSNREAWLRLRRYADLRCLDAGFLAVVSLAPFLPWIGISISFWPADALRVFLSGFAGGEDALPILWRNASIKSTTFSPRGRALAVTGFPARLLLMSSPREASY